MGLRGPWKGIEEEANSRASSRTRDFYEIRDELQSSLRDGVRRESRNSREETEMKLGRTYASNKKLLCFVYVSNK